MCNSPTLGLDIEFWYESSVRQTSSRLVDSVQIELSWCHLDLWLLALFFMNQKVRRLDPTKQYVVITTLTTESVLTLRVPYRKL